ncbi:Nitrogen permease regulator-like 3 [Clydaea vesicula]|uniref:Nitrogen permease regulator 3 n=1 Tax=Clydaea vesicula TaxID=447962 RepID=A0AAD5XZ81_9FUNG|nr:Nitrogen permease regulator-like 3 [Clydaea vesicula]
MPAVSILLVCYSARGHQLVFRYPTDQKFQFSDNSLSDFLSPKQLMCDRRFQLSIDNFTFLGHPTLLNADRPGTGHKFSRDIQKRRLALSKNKVEDDDENNIKTHISMFNLVFAFKSEGGKSLLKELDNCYKNILTRVTAALKYEQLKRSYLRTEVELILSIKEGSFSEINNDKITQEQLMDKILNQSSLGKTLQEIFLSIQRVEQCHIVLNHSIDLSLNVKSTIAAPHQIYHNQAVEYSNVTASSAAKENFFFEDLSGKMLRPYKALLLLHDPEEIVKRLPSDPSPLLVELIQLVTPSICFEEIQAALDCSLSQIYRLAGGSPVALDLVVPSVIRKKVRLKYTEGDKNTIENEQQPSQSKIQCTLFANDEPYLMPNPMAPNDIELEYLQLISNFQPPPYNEIFLKIAPYLGGKYHVGEISFRENIRNKELKLVLGRYKDFCITIFRS